MSKTPRFQTFRQLVGRTPMVDLTHLQEREDIQIAAKCEFMNPGYSVKDRIVEFIFDEAERQGRLKRGSRVLAASSGNTGAAVAMMAAWRGYEAIIITTPKCSKEKMDAIEAYGAKLVVADSNSGGYMAVAEQMAQDDPDLFDVDQYANPLNPEAHYRSLGAEIWSETRGAVTHFTCGASTGGTICGVSRRLKEHKPSIRAILADPKGSIFFDYFHRGVEVSAQPFQVEGVGKGNIPGVMNFDYVDDVIRVHDQQAFDTCRLLASSEGMMVGGSSGLNVYSALQAAKTAPSGSVIITVLVDSGLKYISKVFNREWLQEHDYA